MTTENTTAEVVAKPKRERKNGQTRPEPGSKTGLIWDIADKITGATGVVATKDEVWADYQGKVEGPAEATVSTQYGRWVIFHGYQEQVKAQRKAAKDAKTAGEADEKAKAKQEKEAEKQRKAQEKADKKAKREADKAAKLAEKEAAKKAKTDANTPAVVGETAETVSEDEVELPDASEGEDAGE